MALPNVFSVRMHAQRVLRDVLDDVVDAVEPGGSGDPYATLDADQAEALREQPRGHSKGLALFLTQIMGRG